MIKKLNIITTKSDLKYINKHGCIVCKTNNFNYISVKDTYECNNCRTNYAIDAKGIRNMLLEDKNEIRIYEKEKQLIDDVKVDVVIETKIVRNNRPKIRVKSSNR